MTRPSRTLVAACAAVIPLSLALAGCGGDGIDSDAVAKVGDTQISKSAFDDTVVVEKVVASQQILGGKLFDAKPPKLVSFAPPYTECIAGLKKTAPPDQKIPDSQFKQMCSSAEKSIKDQAVTRLVVEEFLDGEAEKLKIPVTDKEIDKGLDAKLTQAIGGKKNIPKFTALTGLGIESFRDQVRFELISQKIQEKFTKEAGKATPAEIQAEYDKNKKQYTQPEMRDLRVVLTKTQAQAAAAKKKLEGGASFAAVAKASSIDPVSKANGGKLVNMPKGQQEKAFDDAISKAKKGELNGPIKTESGFYVFRVDKVTPPKLVPFKDVKAQIKQQLDTQKPQAAIQKWQTDSIKDWTAKTTCRDGYVVQYCKNAPPPATTGAAPAQQAPPM